MSLLRGARSLASILAVGVVFHLSTLFVMNIFFPHQLVLYLMFVDWDSLARRFTVPSGSPSQPPEIKGDICQTQ